MSVDHAQLYHEPHRPQYHFSPERNWLNDPNGMVYFEGVYHLFYQYNPSDKVWGNMHWGHATSADLLHWQHRPVALHAEPDGLGYIFSGCAVVDHKNQSGLGLDGRPPMIALFTHSSTTNEQVQSLAYSTDAGDTWQMYSGNPVIPNPGIEDFRDPKVIRDEANNCWLMALVAHDCVQFYRSDDLLNWSFHFEFGHEAGCHGGVWECPDFIPMENSSGESKWVLLVSVNPGAPNGGSATQYFVGSYDGVSFQPDHAETLWLDYGPDNYAAVSWSDTPGNRKLIIGWMNNWEYANALPTGPWKGAMTIPRELSLISTPEGERLSSRPVSELLQLGDTPATRFEDYEVTGWHDLFPVGDFENPELLDISMRVDWSESKSNRWLMKFFNDQGEELLLDFHGAVNELHVDRTRASVHMDNVDPFRRIIVAPVLLLGELQVPFRVLIDRGSIEIFLADGRSIVTATYFSAKPLDRVQISSGHITKPVRVRDLEVKQLKSIW